MMLTRMQKLADKILLESEAESSMPKGFSSVDELIEALFDKKYENDLEKLTADKEIVKKIKCSSSDVLDEAMKKIYADYVENPEDKDSKVAQFGKSIFKYLNEIKNFKDKML